VKRRIIDICPGQLLRKSEVFRGAKMSGMKIPPGVGLFLVMVFLLDPLTYALDILLKDGTVITGQVQQDKLDVKTRMGLTILNVEDTEPYQEGIIKLKDGTV